LFHAVFFLCFLSVCYFVLVLLLVFVPSFGFSVGFPCFLFFVSCLVFFCVDTHLLSVKSSLLHQVARVFVQIFCAILFAVSLLSSLSVVSSCFGCSFDVLFVLLFLFFVCFFCLLVLSPSFGLCFVTLTCLRFVFVRLLCVLLCLCLVFAALVTLYLQQFGVPNVFCLMFGVDQVHYMTLMDAYLMCSFVFILAMLVETGVVGKFEGEQLDHSFFWIFLCLFFAYHLLFALIAYVAHIQECKKLTRAFSHYDDYDEEEETVTVVPKYERFLKTTSW